MDNVFVSPDIRKFMSDTYFEFQMTLTEKKVCVSFKNVVTKFLGNIKDSDYINIVSDMLEKFNKPGCLVSLKIRFLNISFSFLFDQNFRFNK